MQSKIFDNFLHPSIQKEVLAFVQKGGWHFGWKSVPNRDLFSIWHKHYAGARGPDTLGTKQYDCAEELAKNAPLLHRFWQHLYQGVLKGHMLERCYANAHAYGAEGTAHTDSVNPDCFTAIYYPNERWSPNWGGETVLFNKEENDIIGCIYPKPNRLFIFPGTMSHVARGVSRTCPLLRISLMFKTQWLRSDMKSS
jgi:SM-20-related protein